MAKHQIPGGRLLGGVLTWTAQTDPALLLGCGLLLLGVLGSFGAVLMMRTRGKRLESIEHQIGVVQGEIIRMRTGRGG